MSHYVASLRCIDTVCIKLILDGEGGRDYCVRLFRQTSEQIAAERASDSQNGMGASGGNYGMTRQSRSLSRQPVDVCSAMVVSS